MTRPPLCAARCAAPVEGRKVLVLEGLAELDDAVGAEVEDDDGVSVDDAPDWLAVVADDDERLELLVRHGVVRVARLGAQRRDSFDGVRERVGRLA